VAINQQLQIILNAQNNTQNAFGQLNKDLNNALDNVKNLVAAFVSYKAIENVISTTMQWDEQVAMLQRNLGLSAQAASTWNFAAQQVGLTTDDVSRAFDLLAKNVDLADQKMKTSAGAGSAIERLGISTRDSTGHLRAISDVMQDVQAKLGGMQNGVQKTALEMELFGRSGAAVNRFLSLAGSSTG
jgi:hypothetical protein